MSTLERQKLREVGISRPRKDAREKLQGKAQYIGDMEMAGMLHGSVLRSPYAHALIRSIDSRRALELDGVVAVLTGADLGDIDPYYGHAIKDRPIIAIDRVRFAGEPVAAVAAVDVETAEAALRLIDVDYEPLAVLDTLEKSLADDAPRLHQRQPKVGLFHGLGEMGEAKGNVCYHHRLGSGDVGSGDVDAAAADAEITVEGEYEFPRSTSTRWRLTRPPPTFMATGSPSGRTASTRFSCRPRSRTSSGSRRERCGSSCPTSAAGSGRSHIRRWSRSPLPWRARPVGQCGS